MAGKTCTVLYVEDEEGDRFFMERAFQAAPFPHVLRMVPDGRAALHYLAGFESYADRAQNPEPDFVLLDLNLPELSGFEVLEWIRKTPPHANLPVVLFTSSTEPRDRDRARKLGADDFWQKPSSGSHFGQIVARIGERLSAICPVDSRP